MHVVESQPEVGLGRVEVGEVVFKDLDDAPLLRERGQWDRQLTKLPLREMQDGRPRCPLA
jgi:hypothetical protein